MCEISLEKGVTLGNFWLASTTGSTESCELALKSTQFPMGTILLIILILLVIGALPTWPYSSRWGYYPTGGLGLLVAIVLILVLLGRI
jgi:hypothetical protein